LEFFRIICALSAGGAIVLFVMNFVVSKIA